MLVFFVLMFELLSPLSYRPTVAVKMHIEIRQIKIRIRNDCIERIY